MDKTEYRILEENWNELIIPSNFDVQKDLKNPHKANIIVEPLESGFGITLGNALRRILLSSLRGAAVVSVQIANVLHEFSHISGVKEDVINIILNIKALRFKVLSLEQQKIHLKARGPGVITAVQLQHSSEIEIVNKEAVICTLNEDSSIEITLTVATGSGYVPAEKNKTEPQVLGLIPIDAFFSPIRRVTFHIENSRVGQRTDYDKLILNVETDGSVTPDRAVALAAKILQQQCKVFIDFKEMSTVKPEKKDTLPYSIHLLRRIDELEVSVRICHCFEKMNITYLGDLVHKTEHEMLQTSNFGKKSLNELKALLASMGLCFGMHIPGWPPKEPPEELLKKYSNDY